MNCPKCNDSVIKDLSLLTGGEWLAGADGEMHWVQGKESVACGASLKANGTN